MKSEQYLQGRRAGIQWAITFLHKEAAGMNDPHARQILDGAAFRMGVEAKLNGTSQRTLKNRLSA